MNQTKVNTQPKADHSDISICLEQFDGLTTVAAPDGESANETQFERTYPEHGTQAARLLAGLFLEEAFTHKEAWDEFGISRLAAVVYELKHKFGWRVENPGLRVANRFGEETTIGLYKLHIDDIEWAGGDGLAYAKTEFELMDLLEEIARGDR